MYYIHVIVLFGTVPMRLSFLSNSGRSLLSLFLYHYLFVCLFVCSFKSKWSPNVNLLILNAKLKEGEKKKKVLITNFSLGVLFNPAISLNTLLVDMNLQIKKKNWIIICCSSDSSESLLVLSLPPTHWFELEQKQ